MCDALSGLGRYQPVPWELIPDLGLYMDQVITLIARMYEPLYGDDMRPLLSPAMINNYVKGGLIPRPTGKKYSRDQVALLAMIVPLKQVSSMEDIRKMLALKDGETAQALYAGFCQRFAGCLHGLRQGRVDFDAPRSALDFAILASAFRAGCAAALRDGQ